MTGCQERMVPGAAGVVATGDLGREVTLPITERWGWNCSLRGQWGRGQFKDLGVCTAQGINLHFSSHSQRTCSVPGPVGPCPQGIHRLWADRHQESHIHRGRPGLECALCWGGWQDHRTKTWEPVGRVPEPQRRGGASCTHLGWCQRDLALPKRLWIGRP